MTAIRACAAALLGLWCLQAQAQAQAQVHAQAHADWPNRPVTIVVPSSPGGGTDAYGRILAQALTDQLKQTFFVENKPGASGAIGATPPRGRPGQLYRKQAVKEITCFCCTTYCDIMMGAA